MGILAINTAEASTSIAFGINNQTVFALQKDGKQSHAEACPVLLQKIVQTIRQHHHPITAIAICIGPGSYTALRIGITTAKILALSWSIPLIALRTSLIYSSLLHQNPSPQPLNHNFAIILETHRQDFWVETFSHSPPFSPLQPPQILNLENLSSLLSSQTFYVTGHGVPRFLSSCQTSTPSIILPIPHNFSLADASLQSAFAILNASQPHPAILNNPHSIDTLSPVYFGDIA